ncbi:hypothetical protein NKH71_30930 [Mesorhizobium sp. M0983]|uniref:hypothetical protein n=1 Tax=Mesorhizobium sp. M0983 TaxID=2957040 RepID=UPI00333B9A43
MAVNANIEEYSGSRFIGAVACYGIEAGRWKICSLDNHLDQKPFQVDLVRLFQSGMNDETMLLIAARARHQDLKRTG